MATNTSTGWSAAVLNENRKTVESEGYTPKDGGNLLLNVNRLKAFSRTVLGTRSPAWLRAHLDEPVDGGCFDFHVRGNVDEKGLQCLLTEIGLAKLRPRICRLARGRVLSR